MIMNDYADKSWIARVGEGGLEKFFSSVSRLALVATAVFVLLQMLLHLDEVIEIIMTPSVGS